MNLSNDTAFEQVARVNPQTRTRVVRTVADNLKNIKTSDIWQLMQRYSEYEDVCKAELRIRGVFI